MGDQKNPNNHESSISPLLPPGIRFYPTEHQLLSFYLYNKNNNQNPNLSLIPSTSGLQNPIFGIDFIQEIDFYKFDPCDLSEISSFSYGHGGTKKHSYCYTMRMGIEDLEKRKGKGGFWKCKGARTNVMSVGGEIILGTKWSFVFYRRNRSSRSSVKTNWVMIEYALIDNRQDAFVLCRVFLKSARKNRVEHVPRPYGDNIATTHNILTDAPSKKLDIPVLSASGKVVAHEDRFVPKDEIETCPSKLTRELNDVISSQQVSDGGSGSPVGTPRANNLVKLSDGIIGGGIISYDAMVDKFCTDPTIFEGDFLELDDLLSPLEDVDASG
ncbi:NAC domain-containing protein 71-like [Papaver somniferum]|nr:NAC domain-containing protein 71-like [Papaver somniferum]